MWIRQLFFEFQVVKNIVAKPEQSGESGYLIQLENASAFSTDGWLDGWMD